jgi:hypothetical protein
LLLRRSERYTIEIQKSDRRNERCTFVAVCEGMGFRKALSVDAS